MAYRHAPTGFENGPSEVYIQGTTKGDAIWRADPKGESTIVTANYETGAPSAAREGIYLMRNKTEWFDVPQEWQRNYRGEVVPESGMGYSSPNSTMVYGSEHWFGFSIYIPDNWVYSTTSNSSGPDNIIFQVHTCDWGDCPNTLPYAVTLQLFSRGGNANRWRGITLGANPETSYETLVYDDYVPDIGTWVDWAIHYKICNEGQNDGFCQFYKNGQAIGSLYQGKNYADGHATHPANVQMGLYTSAYRQASENPNWTSTTQTLYRDSFRWGDGNESLTSVSPGAPLPDPDPEPNIRRGERSGVRIGTRTGER